MRSIVLAGAVLTLAATAAAAQDAVHATASIDLSPLLKSLLDYSVAAMVPIITWLVGRYIAPVLVEHLGEQSAQVARDGLNDIMAKGIRLGASKLGQNIDVSVNIKNQLVHDAVEYTLKSAPGWVGKFGLTRDRVEDMVRARLGQELRSALDDQAAVAAKLPG